MYEKVLELLKEAEEAFQNKSRHTLEYVQEAITLLESEKPLATGRIQGVRYTEGQCFIVVGSLDAQAPQFGEIVTIMRKPDADLHT